MTEKIYIRKIEYSDTDLIVKWRNQENVRQFFFYREQFTRDIHEAWMKNKVETGDVVQFIICLVENDTAVGSTYLRDIDYDKKIAEYGVFIGDETVRGMGIGKEALKKTLQYANKELGLKKVIARAISTNKPSIYSFLNSGFKIDEEIDSVPCSDGKLEKMVMMSIEL